MRENINILIKKFEIEGWFEKIVQKFEKIENIKSDQISIVIVGDQRIRTLNRKYRKKDKITDVLSFVQSDIDQKYRLANNSYLGEIFINFRQAQRQSKNVKDEMLNLLVHAYLHLRGHTHDNEKELVQMKSMTEKIIKKLK